VNGAELEVLLRAVVAGVLGYVIGAEREYIAHREAGTSTFGLVAMAAALITALARLVFDASGASRVIANILVGVGFLGGGMIVKDIVHIRGLTTAAGMWAMASAGIVIGSGHYLLGVAVSLLVLLLFSAEHLDPIIRARLGRWLPPPPSGQ
jgi:putative Mg2+ transporter-C (MgtC) family protein